MALYRRLLLDSSKPWILNFSTSCSVNNKWRIQKGIERNPRAFTPLTMAPDYSFVDGRPMILSNRKLIKIKYQQELCKRVVELTHEIDVGLEGYYKREEQKRKEKEAKLRTKLKPKGVKLLSQKHSSSSAKS